MERNDQKTKIIRIFGTLFSNDSIYFSKNLEASDINVKSTNGGLKVDGNVKSRNISISSGNLEVKGTLNAKGNIEIEDGEISISSNCTCYSIKAKGPIFIGGDCTTSSIISSDDVIIEGKYFGKVESILIPNDCHLVIDGKNIK